MVTRCPARLMAPSTRPSMYRASEPVTSPLMISDFPIVADSWLLITALRGAGAGVGSAGMLLAVLIGGFSGSGAAGFGLGLGLDGVAFHICRCSFHISH